VVRPKPGSKGDYELAYGHHRLAAMKKIGMKSAEFIIQDIDDWGMLTAMVDENESQQNQTPELVYENIEAGINFLEPVIKKCETLDQYRAVVPRGTVGNDNRPEDYQKIRNAVLSGEGLGVKFLSRELPGKGSARPSNIKEKQVVTWGRICQN
jgi:ParB/Sulfiredoxin domain